jgi:hypothetical protein
MNSCHEYPSIDYTFSIHFLLDVAYRHLSTRPEKLKGRNRRAMMRDSFVAAKLDKAESKMTIEEFWKSILLSATSRRVDVWG